MIGRPPQQPKTELAQRLVAARGEVSREEFALQTEISMRSLGSYERGDSLPDAAFMAKLVEKYGVDLNWLIAGQARQGESKGTVDLHALEEIVQSVLEWREKRSPELDPRQTASLIATFYNKFSSGGKFSDEDMNKMAQSP